MVTEQPGLTDREVTNHLLGRARQQAPVNQACHQLETQGLLLRRQRGDGLIANYPSGTVLPSLSAPAEDSRDALSEDALKRMLKTWLEADGWTTKVAWGQSHGIDIEALRGKHRWVIEVKGRGTRSAMRVNYFLGGLGELLQRMGDAESRYSLALPDLPQFRNLWAGLPILAKSRLGLAALFVDENGRVHEDPPQTRACPVETRQNSGRG